MNHKPSIDSTTLIPHLLSLWLNVSLFAAFLSDCTIHFIGSRQRANVLWQVYKLVFHVFKANNGSKTHIHTHTEKGFLLVAFLNVGMNNLLSVCLYNGLYVCVKYNKDWEGKRVCVCGCVVPT